MAGTHHEYSTQARTYDLTRSASPSVLQAIEDALADAPGRALLDAGGGTGNYAAALAGRGWEPVVADLNAAMLARAAAKGLKTVRAEAAALPFGDESFDAVTAISMLHHVVDWRGALGEMRRVLRPGGRLALMVYTVEHMEQVHWAFDLFPSARSWLVAMHQTEAQIAGELPGARHIPFEFTDIEDGSVAALCRRPELLLDAERRRQTSFFERLEREDPAGARAGLETLAAWLAASRRPDEERAAARAQHGDGSVFAWAKPALG